MRIHRLLLLALMATVFAQCLGLNAVAAAAGPGPSGGGGDLYVLQAQGGTLNGSKLVLSGVAPRVTSFTDRPRRSVASLAAGALASGWGSIFGTDPPNAALEVEGAPKDRDVAVLELSHPRYEARTRTLTYSVRRLTKTGDPALKEFDRRADGRAVRSFGPSSLFIDAGEAEPLPAIVQIFVPAGQRLTINFEGAVTYGNGIFIAGINTPTTNTYSSSNGEINLKGSSMVFEASSGGGGLNAQVLAYLSVENGHIGGEATIPSGAQASVAGPDEQGHELTGGKFSFTAP